MITKTDDFVCHKNHVLKAHGDELGMAFRENIAMFTSLVAIIRDVPLDGEMRFAVTSGH